MEILRTPDERFERLPDFPYPPRYVEVDKVLEGAGHFIQEDKGEELGHLIVAFLRS